MDQTSNLGSGTDSPTTDANHKIIRTASLSMAGLMLSDTASTVATGVDKSYSWDTFIITHLVKAFIVKDFK